MKTVASDVRPTTTPSSGTGSASAIAAARRSAPIPAAAAADGLDATSAHVAAATAAAPARMTGPITGSARRVVLGEAAPTALRTRPRLGARVAVAPVRRGSPTGGCGGVCACLRHRSAPQIEDRPMLPHAPAPWIGPYVRPRSCQGAASCDPVSVRADDGRTRRGGRHVTPSFARSSSSSPPRRRRCVPRPGIGLARRAPDGRRRDRARDRDRPGGARLGGGRACTSSSSRTSASRCSSSSPASR